MMKIEMMNIELLKENPNNPRKVSEVQLQKLKKSIIEFPQMLLIRPLVIDADNIVLGGNMRLKALKELDYKEVPIIRAEELTEKQKDEFIIKDNLAYGEWNWEGISLNWDNEILLDWGLEVPGFDINADEFNDDFKLDDSAKAPYQKMIFKLADEQVTYIQNALSDIKRTEEYKYVETFGNENTNGNALYLMIQQWAGQRK